MMMKELMGVFAMKRDDDEKAVEEVMREAMDMVILEQVAAINNLPLPSSTNKSSCNNRLQHTSSPPIKKSVGAKESMYYDPIHRKNGKQTMIKEEENLEQYEKWFSQKTKESPRLKTFLSPPPPKSSNNHFWRFTRGGFWCWRGESREKMVEKARKEEEEAKICVEAQKVCDWVNLASARMDAYI